MDYYIELNRSVILYTIELWLSLDGLKLSEKSLESKFMELSSGGFVAFQVSFLSDKEEIDFVVTGGIRVNKNLHVDIDIMFVTTLIIGFMGSRGWKIIDSTSDLIEKITLVLKDDLSHPVLYLG